MLEVYTEQHNNKWFLYNKETNAFIAQGDSLPTAIEAAKETLLEANAKGELKKAFFTLPIAVQAEVRDFANELKKTA